MSEWSETLLTDSTRCHCRWIPVLSIVGIWLLLPTAWGDGLRPWVGRSRGCWDTAQLPLAAGGDLDGDGRDDVVVGAPFEGGFRGRLEVYRGRQEGLGVDAWWSQTGASQGDWVGASVAVGDFNGDGIGDLATMERTFQDDTNGSRRWFTLRFFSGSAGAYPGEPTRTWLNGIGRFAMREALAAAGDVNGDGFQDLAVIATDPESKIDEGFCVIVIHGSPDGVRQEAAWVAHSEQADSNFGATFGAAGDVNGDGYGDFLVGATRFSGKYAEGGKVYLYLGSKGGLSSQPAWTAEYPLPFDPAVDGGGAIFFGWGLGAAGDVNRDGYGDVVIGAWNGSRGDAEEGLAFLYLGNRSGLESEPAWWVEGNLPHAHLGASVRGVGDVNGDGYADVAVGVPFASHGQNDEGVVVVFHGCPAGLESDPAWTLDGDRSNGRMGGYVGSAGDVNGDGLPDLLLAGIEMTTGEPMLRPLVVYGQRGGLTGSSGWSWRKPWTTAVAQWFDRLPRPLLWGLAVAGSAGLLLSLLWAHFRVRRELARVIAENRRLASMQERARIARDLHDHLGADLARLAVQLDRGADAEKSLMIEAWQSSAQEAVKTLDELVWATNPSKDTVESLADYLAEYCPDFLNAHGVACEVDFPDQLPPHSLPSRTRHALFLVAKEALRNVVQHARATRVRIALATTPSTLVLTIEDNGRGMASYTGDLPRSKSQQIGRRTHQGNGLTNMKDRVSELGGVFRMEPVVDGGMRIMVETPLSGSCKEPTSGA